MGVWDQITSDVYAGHGGSYIYDPVLDIRTPNNDLSIAVDNDVIIDHKRGDDPLVLDMQALNSDGSVFNITGYVLAAQAKTNSGTLISTPSISLVNAANGEYTLTFANTTSWPITGLLVDVQYTSPSSQVESTRTFRIRVLSDITS